MESRQFTTDSFGQMICVGDIRTSGTPYDCYVVLDISDRDRRTYVSYSYIADLSDRFLTNVNHLNKSVLIVSANDQRSWPHGDLF
jgi:hypothetical protein